MREGTYRCLSVPICRSQTSHTHCTRTRKHTHAHAHANTHTRTHARTHAHTQSHARSRTRTRKRMLAHAHESSAGWRRYTKTKGVSVSDADINVKQNTGKI